MSDEGQRSLMSAGRVDDPDEENSMQSGTLSDVEAFRDFLNDRIHAGDVDESVEEFVLQWRQLRQPTDDSISAVRAGLAEAKAGLGRPFRKVLEELQSDNETVENQ
jgi:hypothetical protein